MLIVDLLGGVGKHRAMAHLQNLHSRETERLGSTDVFFDSGLGNAD